MANYTAPINDMMFLFEKLRDNKHYNDLEKYNEVNSELAKDDTTMDAVLSDLFKTYNLEKYTVVLLYYPKYKKIVFHAFAINILSIYKQEICIRIF